MLEEKTQELMVNMQAVLPLIVTNALSALGAIVILLIGLWLSGKADQLVVRVLSRTPHFDPTLKSFFGSLARYLILTVTLLAVLSQFGIQTTSLVAVIGAASLAVGLALQGTLSNLAAGIMLLIFRPFRVGHKVQVGGSLGTVKELSLFWTELVTDDKVQIIVPNGGVWGQPLRNFTSIRRLHMPARCASGPRRGPSSSRRSKRFAPSSKPIRACSPTPLRACCWIAAPPKMRSKSSSRFLPRMTRSRP
jgi:small conductance mechanosensitive channel